MRERKTWVKGESHSIVLTRALCHHPSLERTIENNVLLKRTDACTVPAPSIYQLDDRICCVSASTGLTFALYLPGPSLDLIHKDVVSCSTSKEQLVMFTGQQRGSIQW